LLLHEISQPRRRPRGGREGAHRALGILRHRHCRRGRRSRLARDADRQSRGVDDLDPAPAGTRGGFAAWVASLGACGIMALLLLRAYC